MSDQPSITDHPYIDNNGPTYTYGICAHGQCGRPVGDHKTMVRADRVGGKRRTVPAPGAAPDPEPEPRTSW